MKAWQWSCSAPHRKQGELLHGQCNRTAMRSCVHFGHVEAVWFLWDCLRASSGQLTAGWENMNVHP